MNESAPTRSRESREEFWRAATPEREPLRWGLFLPALALLLLLNVPWYLTPEVAEGRFYGLPTFAWICLATSVAISILSCTAALRHWQSDSDSARDREAEHAEKHAHTASDET